MVLQLRHPDSYREADHGASLPAGRQESKNRYEPINFIVRGMVSSELKLSYFNEFVNAYEIC